MNDNIVETLIDEDIPQLNSYIPCNMIEELEFKSQITEKLNNNSLLLHPDLRPNRIGKSYFMNNVNFIDFSNFDKAIKTAEMLAKSRCIPQQFWDKPEDILVVVQMGYELNIPPMIAIQNSMIVNNRPSLWGDVIVAVCMRGKGLKGGFIDYIETFDESTQTATCTVKRDGRDPVTKTYSKEKATKAGLWEKRGSTGAPSAWVTNPEVMLQARARGFAFRAMFPDLLKGIYSIEEVWELIEYTTNKNNEIVKNTVDSMKESLKLKAELNKTSKLLTQESQND